MRGDYNRALAFLHEVQSALQRNDSTKLSHMVQYPMLADIGGKRVHIRNPQSFVANYPLIFTKPTRKTLLRCHDADMWWRDTGYTVGSGIIWFDGRMPAGQHFPDTTDPNFWKVGVFKIITVNGTSSPDERCER
jgi:hypothetical protein